MTLGKEGLALGILWSPLRPECLSGATSRVAGLPHAPSLILPFLGMLGSSLLK